MLWPILQAGATQFPAPLLFSAVRGPHAESRISPAESLRPGIMEIRDSQVLHAGTSGADPHVLGRFRPLGSPLVLAERGMFRHCHHNTNHCQTPGQFIMVGAKSPGSDSVKPRTARQRSKVSSAPLFGSSSFSGSVESVTYHTP
ncbi:hypothetical protein NDU88_009192 [Pleurodeles waltl]|uniref:Uncharacterized protein n=1 Tax=Pleurodeles waltl TaxID=8319 RepID=A0AAV7QV25_PLEWA|nr:hypothetical protein NDU88_009192 [Pleurodeles waltl]